MKVYLIETSSGSYDDYYTYIKTGFLDKCKAEKYVEKYNKRLKDKRTQSDVCGACKSGKYDYLSNAIRACNLNARIVDITDKSSNYGELYFDCKKSKYDEDAYENHEARIKEIEIIE